MKDKKTEVNLSIDLQVISKTEEECASITIIPGSWLLEGARERGAGAGRVAKKIFIGLDKKIAEGFLLCWVRFGFGSVFTPD